MVKLTEVRSYNFGIKLLKILLDFSLFMVLVVNFFSSRFIFFLAFVEGTKEDTDLISEIVLFSVSEFPATLCSCIA